MATLICTKTLQSSKLLWPMGIESSGKSAHFAQKRYFYQKTTTKKSSKLSIVKVWSKENMQNIAYTKALNLEL